MSWIDFVDGIFNRIEEVTCFNYEYWFDNLSSDDVSRETSEDRLRIKSYNPILTIAEIKTAVVRAYVFYGRFNIDFNRIK